MFNKKLHQDIVSLINYQIENIYRSDVNDCANTILQEVEEYLFKRNDNGWESWIDNRDYSGNWIDDCQDAYHDALDLCSCWLYEANHD